MKSERVLEWDDAVGTCPSCGAVTQHDWFDRIAGSKTIANRVPGAPATSRKSPSTIILGWHVSKCVACNALALWVGPITDAEKILDNLSGTSTTEKTLSMAYPQAGVRIPPGEGLNEEEVRLYHEAAAVAPMSPRAGCAMVRVLLEAYLKRHLAKAGHDLKGRPPLARLIESAEDHLDLSPTLKAGLTAIRKRGNTTMHDPYGLTEDARAEDVAWLFRAVDELVDDLHVKPREWRRLSATPDSTNQ